MVRAGPFLLGRPFQTPDFGDGTAVALFFAWLLVINGLFFTAYALISRHVTRDLAPTGKDLRGIGKAVKDHIVLRHPKG